MEMMESTHVIRLKSLPLAAYLASLGYVPAKQVGGQLVYLSPLTGENTPSFFVHPDKNVFNCFSSGQRGDLITLVRKLENMTFRQALGRLETFSASVGRYPDMDFAAAAQKAQMPGHQLQILKLKPLANRVLINYLSSRGIDHRLAGKYVQEAYFSVQGRHLFALAFPNDKSGYELRNPFYKGSAIAKAPTTIAGLDTIAGPDTKLDTVAGQATVTGSGPGRTVNLFEGFLDFLSALACHGIDRFKNDTVILNSLWLMDTVFQKQLLETYGQVNLFLDNDRPGWRKAVELRRLAVLTGAKKDKVRNCSSLYRGHKDYNAFLVGNGVAARGVG